MERTSWFRHPALRRLPIIAVAAVGIWLWQTGAKDREILWLLPEDRADIQQIRIQLREPGGGKLLRGHELFFENRPVPSEIRTEVKAAEGTYEAQVTLQRKGERGQTLTREVRISGEATSVRLW